VSNALQGLNALTKLIDIFGGSIVLTTQIPDKTSYDPTTDTYGAYSVNESTVLSFAPLRRNSPSLPKTLIGNNRQSGYIPVTSAQIIKSHTTFTFQNITYKIDYFEVINNGDSAPAILISGETA